MLPDLVDGRGKVVRLGRELGRGGEGTVFSITGNPQAVAKVYHTPLAPEKVDKIRVMAGMRSDRIAALTAWPTDLLSKRSGEAVGLLMPNVSGRTDLHNLYGPKSRRQHFLRADWRFLVRASANLARAFAVVHESGCVIGDVNHGGALVGEDATIRLIDCDSFQLLAGGNKFLCEVGVETFTPPELQGHSFAGLVRTENHDNFGLAVLIFLTLLMGRHPFAGRHLGTGDVPLAKAIAELRFAYGSQAAARKIAPPPGAPSLQIVSAELGAMFEHSFTAAGAAGQRPTAREWADALQRFETQLQQCRATPSHWYFRDLQACPWCTMEAATGALLFPAIAPHLPGNAFNFERFWCELSLVPHPGPAPPLSMAPTAPSRHALAESLRWKRKKLTTQLVAACATAAALAALSVFGSLWFAAILGAGALLALRTASRPFASIGEFEKRHDIASSRWAAARREWAARCEPEMFDVKKAELEQLRQSWTELPALRLQKLNHIRRDRRRIELERFLDRFPIESADIPGIGPCRSAVLRSFGIETAADIEQTKLRGVPGIGPRLSGNLLLWRRAKECRFVFNPNCVSDPREVTRVDREIAVERCRIEAAMAKALVELKEARRAILAARQRLKAPVESAYREYAQAVADLEAARG